MLEAAKVICQHVEGKTFSDLEEDRLLFGAVIRELLLIGEAANAVSTPSRKEFAEIPWKSVIGMRNQLVHGYFAVNYRIVWSTATEDIPVLIGHLEKALQSPRFRHLISPL